MNVLQIEGLSKNYGKIRALNGLNLTIESGQVMGLLGPNGSGKTTTLGILLGILHADAGSYRWFEGQYPENEARKKIGAILETPNFYPYLNADDNLDLYRKIKGAPPQSFDDILRQVNLIERRKSPFSSYSLGMKQRLAVAATLIGDPDILIFDEPTNGLDPNGIAEMRQIIQDIASQGKTVLMASHILDEVEKICSHVTILQKGKLLASGPIGHILTENSFILLNSENNDRLITLLHDKKGVLNITKKDNMIMLEVDKNLSAQAVNRLAADGGIWLSYLEERKNTLEEEFIEITQPHHSFN